jgi:hypothetical protein
MHGGKASFLAVRHSPEVLLHVRSASRKGYSETIVVAGETGEASKI